MAGAKSKGFADVIIGKDRTFGIDVGGGKVITYKSPYENIKLLPKESDVKASAIESSSMAQDVARPIWEIPFEDIQAATKGELDWMKPKKYTQKDAMNLLQDVYPLHDFTNVKLGEGVTEVPIKMIDPRSGNIIEPFGRAVQLPPKNYLDVLEQVRLGNKTHTQAAVELGLARSRAKPREKQFQTREGFEKVWNKFLELHPVPKEITMPESTTKIKEKPASLEQKTSYDLIDAALQGDKNTPFEVRVFNAFKDKFGIPAGEKITFKLPTGKTKAGAWDRQKDRIGNILSERLGYDVDFRLWTGRYDVNTRTYNSIDNLVSLKEAFDAAPDGSILTGNARTHVRFMDYKDQRRHVAQAAKKDSQTNSDYNDIKEWDPQSYWQEIDHIQATLFNGPDALSNLSMLVTGSHRGSPIMQGNKKISRKTGLDQALYHKQMDIINIFNPSSKTFKKDLTLEQREAKAQEMANEVEMMVDSFIENNPKIDFKVGDPWVFEKDLTAEKEYKKYAYIDTLPPEMKNIAKKYIKTYENLPNKDRSLQENIRGIWEQLVVLRDQKGKLEPDPQVAKGLVTQKKGGMIQSSLASVEEVLNGI